MQFDQVVSVYRGARLSRPLGKRRINPHGAKAYELVEIPADAGGFHRADIGSGQSDCPSAGDVFICDVRETRADQLAHELRRGSDRALSGELGRIEPRELR